MSIRDRLRRFIMDSFLIDQVSDGESFLGSGIIDSLGVMQLVAFVESDLGVKVSDADLNPENFDSIDKVVAFVERRLGTASSALSCAG